MLAKTDRFHVTFSLEFNKTGVTSDNSKLLLVFGVLRDSQNVLDWFASQQVHFNVPKVCFIE
jgi:hypothetical protein